MAGPSGPQTGSALAGANAEGTQRRTLESLTLHVAVPTTVLLSPCMAPSELDPLRGGSGRPAAPAGWLARARADVAWADAATHSLLLEDVVLGRCTWQTTVRRWWIRYNPAYWVCYAPTGYGILVGRWAHRLVAQDGPVRSPESALELHVRVAWIYCADGFLCSAAALGLVQLAWGARTSRMHTALTALGVAVDLAYAGGNALFFEAMRRRRGLLVKVFVGLNYGFGAGLAMQLGLCAVVQRRPLGDMLLRLLVVLFVGWGAGVFTAVWPLYDDASSWTSKCGAWTAAFVAAAATWGLVTALFAMFGDHAWDIFVPSFGRPA